MGFILQWYIVFLRFYVYHFYHGFKFESKMDYNREAAEPLKREIN